MARRRMATLWYDDEDGELCEVAFTQAFIGENDLMRADVLQDVEASISAAYKQAVHAVFPFIPLSEVWH